MSSREEEREERRAYLRKKDRRCVGRRSSVGTEYSLSPPWLLQLFCSAVLLFPPLKIVIRFRASCMIKRRRFVKCFLTQQDQQIKSFDSSSTSSSMATTFFPWRPTFNPPPSRPTALLVSARLDA